MLATPRRASSRAQRAVRPEARVLQPRAGTVVPYDAAARFELKGQPGRIVQDVINISPDAIFVAVAIGYGFEQERIVPLTFSFSNANYTPEAVKDLKLKDFPLSALIEGFRLHHDFENVVFQPLAKNGVTGGIGDFSAQPVSLDLLNRTFQLVRPVKDITFLFSMVDSSSGRELMDQPEHSLSGLGRGDGERPFRLLARPLKFLPRSTIRIQVIEQTPGVTGTLYIVLYGYKVLVGSDCPEPSGEWMAEAAARGSLLNLAGERAIPFDSVAKFTLTGRRGNKLEDEITITTEGAFVTTATGYGLSVESEDVAINRERASAAITTAETIDLSKVPLAALPPISLLDGIRIRPKFLRIALQPLQPGGTSLATVPLDVVDHVFERLNRSDDVVFRYTIYDAGTGQAWQNVPLFNVAGLGIANGLRPFKQLARPAILAPRSSLQITVEERFGRGVLFIAFQGYKRVGAYGAGGKS